jgi:hypothetical protein
MPAPKDYVKIKYPRKCEDCDYVSNNPTMYHYHKKTHEPIPLGTLCNHGCGYPAQYRGTGGTYSCQQISHRCPEYIKQHSIRIAEQWQRPDSVERKLKTKERFFEHCCGVPKVLEKQRETLKKKWGDFTPEQMKDFRHYARRVRARAQKWAKDQGYVLGQQTYHVDHKLSVREAWLAGLSEEVVNHPYNLRILEAKANSSKGSKSTLTVDQLLLAVSPSVAPV